MFPVVFIGLTWLFFFLLSLNLEEQVVLARVNNIFSRTVPCISAGCHLVYSSMAFSHSSMINKAADSKPLERSENKRVYNLVENLCISTGNDTCPKSILLRMNR